MLIPELPRLGIMMVELGLSRIQKCHEYHASSEYQLVIWDDLESFMVCPKMARVCARPKASHQFLETFEVGTCKV